MTTIGVMTGRMLGEKFGRLAEAAGGVVLIAIGGSILARHLLG
jgi:putative Mn2+ efflux pump MntP